MGIAYPIKSGLSKRRRLDEKYSRTGETYDPHFRNPLSFDFDQ